LFFEKAVAQLDEGWYLKGQLYESPKASFRNIRTARDSYQALVDRYPSSVLWQKANNRILYIDRYYFKIR
jgi:outer membrane protein assembly factor BamD (BamD/ComL family)